MCRYHNATMINFQPGITVATELIGDHFFVVAIFNFWNISSFQRFKLDFWDISQPHQVSRISSFQI